MGGVKRQRQEMERGEEIEEIDVIMQPNVEAFEETEATETESKLAVAMLALDLRMRYADLIRRAVFLDKSHNDLADILLKFASAHDIALKQERTAKTWSNLKSKSSCCEEAFRALENDIAGKKKE